MSPKEKKDKAMSPFSSWLNSHIQGEGWQPADLARKMRVNPSLVSKWLHDEAKPSSRMTSKLCIIFGVPADYLMPIINYSDVVDQVDPPQRDAMRAELLTRIPEALRLIEVILALPLEKQSTYIDLAINILRGQDRKDPKA